MLLCAAGGLYTTEESLPLTTVSFRAPCTALSIHSHFFFLYENMSASLHMNLQLVFNAAPPCFFLFSRVGVTALLGELAL